MRRTGVSTRRDRCQPQVKGLLTERDVQFAASGLRVAEMTGSISSCLHGHHGARRRRATDARPEDQKLPLVNPDGTVFGLITARPHQTSQHPLPRATIEADCAWPRRSGPGRLPRARHRGAARRGRARDRHRAGHSLVMTRAIDGIRSATATWNSWPPTSPAERSFLLDRGVNGIKVIGPEAAARRGWRPASACRRSRRSFAAVR